MITATPLANPNADPGVPAVHEFGRLRVALPLNRDRTERRPHLPVHVDLRRVRTGVHLVVGFRGDETNQWLLRVPDGKGSKERQTPIPADLAGRVRAFAGGFESDDSVLSVTTRTLRRWVTRAAEERTAVEGDDRWLHLEVHDLRRMWGHLLLEAEVLPSVLM